MKHIMKKLISLTMVLILLLGSFAGCGNANSNDEDVIPPLSEEKELEFKELFYNKHKDNYHVLTLDAIIVNFLGEFNGSYAVMFEFAMNAYKMDHYEIVGGFEFAYPKIQPITIIKGDEMYGLEEAYNNGLVNDEDLSLLCKRCRPTCTATLDDKFDTKRILVKVMPSSNFKEYTPDDFLEINCVEVIDLLTTKEYKEGELGRWLILTVKSYSKKKILKDIKKLEQRSDVYCAQPKYNIEWHE